MTTYLNFTPNMMMPFQFTAALDGVQYTIIITWSLGGKRWYLNVYTTNGTLVLAKALVGSPPNYDINLVWGYFFISTLVYRMSTNQFEISP